MLLFEYKIYDICTTSSVAVYHGIVTNELFMDSGFEDKQNRVLVMTRKGIYIHIYRIFDFC